LTAPGCSSEKPEITATTTPAQEITQIADMKVTEAPADMPESQDDGKALFRTFCSKCHKNGGNIINKDKPIYRTALATRNMDNVESIIQTMRNPGPKMKKFDETMIPDTEAKKIAEYILKT
jgi:mono/diheme cytochrome c family protein